MLNWPQSHCPPPPQRAWIPHLRVVNAQVSVPFTGPYPPPPGGQRGRSRSHSGGPSAVVIPRPFFQLYSPTFFLVHLPGANLATGPSHTQITMSFCPLQPTPHPQTCLNHTASGRSSGTVVPPRPGHSSRAALPPPCLNSFREIEFTFCAVCPNCAFQWLLVYLQSRAASTANSRMLPPPQKESRRSSALAPHPLLLPASDNH